MNMLKTLADYLRALLNFTQTQEDNKREIIELREEVVRLTNTLQLVALQLRHELENQNHALDAERHEREKFMLQIENELLRRLPPKSNE